jgi:hypothetical protein
LLLPAIPAGLIFFAARETLHESDHEVKEYKYQEDTEQAEAGYKESLSHCRSVFKLF